MDKIKKILKSVWATYLYYKYKRLYKKDPKLAADSLYYKIYKKHMNLSNPRNLIEKITWLSLNTDTSLWTLCADKYRMRNYVKSKGLEEFLPKCYGHWNNPKDIDFENLPDQFVLKTNNGCATVLIVKDKSQLNIQATISKLKKWLKRPFGYIGAEKHYLSIKPCILAEELLKQNAEYNTISPHSMVDFKIWCLNGQPESILVIYDRTPQNIKIALFNLNWEPISENLRSCKKDTFHPEIQIPRPKHLEQMIEMATILSKDFKEVRVDFYETEKCPIIGELTFTTGYGYFTDEYYNYLGDKIKLN